VHRVIDGSCRETDPRTAEGQLDFYFQGMFSAMDRDNLVQAQIGGKFSRSRENHLTITYTALPPGWRRDSGSTRPVVDESAAPLVRMLIRAIGYESKDTLRHVIRKSRMVSPRNSPVNRWTWDPAAVEQQLRAWSLPVPEAPAPRTMSEEGDRLFADSRSLDVYRLSKWLTAWETSVFEWETQMPRGSYVNVPGIPHWQEESGATFALVRVDLPKPQEPLATADDLRRARVAVDQWMAEAGERGALITAARARGTLPFLSDVGTYRDGGFEYRLMSGRTKVNGNTRQTYQLRRQALSDEPLMWRSGIRTLGEHCATVWADELHLAVADVASQMLREGIVPRPPSELASDYAPVQPVFRRRRMAAPDPLARERYLLAAAEDSRAMAYDMLNEAPIGDPAVYRASIRERLTRAETDIMAIQARISMIEESRRSEVGRDADVESAPVADGASFASELEGMLQVVDHLRGNTLVDPAYASGLREFLRIRVERHDVRWVHLSVEIAVPGEGDTVLVLRSGAGKVLARGYAVAPADEQGAAASRGETIERYAKARQADIVEKIMMHGSDLISLLPPQKGNEMATSAWGRRPRLDAAAHLARLANQRGLELGNKVAAVALRNPLPNVRLALWRAIQGEEPPLTLDPHFAAYVARAYLGEGAAGEWWKGYTLVVGRGDTGAWVHHHLPTASLVTFLGSRPDRAAPASEVARVLIDAGGRSTTVAHLLKGTARAVPLLERRPCLLLDCRPNCRKHSRLGLRRCPHADCVGWLEVPARIFEVPDGVLCSICRRMPNPASPVFPAEYLRAGETYIDDLMRYAPDVLAQRVRQGRRVPDAWSERGTSTSCRDAGGHSSVA
jgi:hypothetical protein